MRGEKPGAVLDGLREMLTPPIAVAEGQSMTAMSVLSLLGDQGPREPIQRQTICSGKQGELARKGEDLQRSGD